MLYVPTVALRSFENPALDVAAIQLSNTVGAPLLVHTFFDDKSVHATARRAHFYLEGLKRVGGESQGHGMLL